jgi:hypothetical protein
MAAGSEGPKADGRDTKPQIAPTPKRKADQKDNSSPTKKHKSAIGPVMDGTKMEAGTEKKLRAELKEALKAELKAELKEQLKAELKEQLKAELMKELKGEKLEIIDLTME